MIRRIPWRMLFLGAFLLAATGCEPHRSFLRPKDEDELPPGRPAGSRIDSDASKIIGVGSDDKRPTSFFKTDRTAGGWSSRPRRSRGTSARNDRGRPGPR